MLCFPAGLTDWSLMNLFEVTTGHKNSYEIVNVNPFMVASNIYEYINGGRNNDYRKISKTLLVSCSENIVNVQYHNTIIFSLDHLAMTYSFQNGGWKTVSTKSNINKMLRAVNSPHRISQYKGEWYCGVPGEPDNKFTHKFSFFHEFLGNADFSGLDVHYG